MSQYLSFVMCGFCYDDGNSQGKGDDDDCDGGQCDDEDHDGDVDDYDDDNKGNSYFY